LTLSLLEYDDDEVRAFHPAFERAGQAALTRAGLDGTLKWEHHRPTDVGVPDFLLIERRSGRWVLVVEIKRRPSAVFAARSQAQAKLYAEAHQDRFRVGRPVYFAITNLEVGVLAALNAGRPPSECVLANGVTSIASFAGDPAPHHEELLVAYLAQVIERVWTTVTESFDVEWPRIAKMWLQHADAGHVTAVPPLPTPMSSAWPELRDYFALPDNVADSRTVLLHAVLAAFLRGRLISDAHPRSATVSPAETRQQVARAIDALCSIDFTSVFDHAAASRYRSNRRPIAQALDTFASALAKPPRLDDLVSTRQDYQQLLEELLLRVYPVQERADRGKVQTDLELAQVLASLSVIAPGKILDPCCGEGSLLVAAVDRLEAIGVHSEDAVTLLNGIEIDRLSALIAGARLALRAGSQLDGRHQPRIVHEDMFVSASDIADADVVLMNPPFLRYEEQRARALPASLRRHFAGAIALAGAGRPPEALGTQPNLFNYFVEFVIRAARPGTRLGLVLDNRWFQNKTGGPLKDLVKRKVRIEAIVDYPHRAFFRDWDIATTLLVGVRDDAPPSSHAVSFVHSMIDPRGVDLQVLSAALHQGGAWPTNWRAQTVAQGSLDPKAQWKPLFGTPLPVDFVACGLPTVSALFERSRRGSLEKEGGGTAAFAFPFAGRVPKKRRCPPRKGTYGTGDERPLTGDEQASLSAAASAVPSRFRGRGLRNSDTIKAYRLGVSDVERDQTLEPPALRTKPDLFRVERRSSWTQTHIDAVAELRHDSQARGYLDAVEQIVNLTSALLPDRFRFVDLREPYAGELIIPKKVRAAHRVHINPFALDPSERQVRTSSNFVTYAECSAVDPASNLGREEAVELIAAFLVSSFGQLQFEIAGRNREGALSVEKEEIDGICIVDPRHITPSLRTSIRAAFNALPFPIRADVRAANQPRAALDRLWAEVLSPLVGVEESDLLTKFHDAVDEWIDARQP
jgi:hypothetical protein